ncbi:MAG: type II secretion system protein [Candidatus Omnitrophica bacterium]|nr:type II secretion system protein [Candidatus Omnitrophota bacterium]
MTKKNAITLLELLMVIIVVGVLAAFALPKFATTREHALTKEAIANLKLVAAAERIYRMETGIFLHDGNEAAINQNLRLSLPTANQNWNYAVTGNTGDVFSATATRNLTGSSCVYTIAQGQDEPVPSGSCN